jgi:site-specific recombinase XerD
VLPQAPSRRQLELLGRIHRLAEFARHGYFRFGHRRKQRDRLPGTFGSVLEEYRHFLTKQQGIRATSLRNRTQHVEVFLRFLDSHGVQGLAEIQPPMLSDFIASLIHLRPATVAGAASDLRRFLRYLCMCGIHAADLSPHVPRIRIWRHDRLPSTWNPEEVEAMVAVIDRSSPVGKRNYAIVLLACRLGLRAGDIRALRLDDLHWDNAQIVIRQSKTGEPLVLPLTEEVGQALIDYLKHGRPKSEHREVFLCANAPFAPFGHSYNFHHIITACRRLAGIKVPRERRCGIHSLRHTLASRLLQKGTPLHVISEILGHRSMDSTRIYTKVDVDALRSAALDAEEVFDD